MTEKAPRSIADIESGLAYFTGLPLFHCNAAIGTGLCAFFNGASVILGGLHGYRSPGISPTCSR